MSINRHFRIGVKKVCFRQIKHYVQSLPVFGGVVSASTVATRECTPVVRYSVMMSPIGSETSTCVRTVFPAVASMGFFQILIKDVCRTHS